MSGQGSTLVSDPTDPVPITQKATLSNIDILPEELLAEIFILQCASNKHGTTATSRCEIVLSHVSHRWREISTSTSRLWTHIHRRVRQQNLIPISIYLARSKQMALDLFVHVSDQKSYNWADLHASAKAGHFHDPYESLTSFCELIEPHISRCRRIELHGENSLEEDLFLRVMLSISAPILESLHLSPRTRGAGVEPEQALFFNGDAPKLKRVSLRYSRALSTIMVPLSYTTHLRLDISRSGRQGALSWITTQLAHCPSLAHLDLGCIATVVWSPINLWLPSLLTFSFEAFNWNQVLMMLCALGCVSLRHLIITVQYADSIPTDSGPLNFPLLHKLSLSLPMSLTTSFEHVSATFPLLSDLSFDISLDMRALIHNFGLFTEMNGSTALASMAWPHLQTIGLNAEPPVEELQSLLTQRANRGIPINCLRIPREHIAKGRELMSTLEPPAVVEEFVKDRLFDRQ